MPYRSAAGNSDEMSDDQCAFDGQYVLCVVGDLRSIPPAEINADQESLYPHYKTMLNLEH